MNFTFEIIEHGHSQGRPKVLSLPNERAIWGCVEALALEIRGRNGAVIQVRNSEGEPIIRAGVRTALTSIEGCQCFDCPLKTELRHGGPHGAAEHPLQVTCPLTARPS